MRMDAEMDTPKDNEKSPTPQKPKTAWLRTSNGQMLKSCLLLFLERCTWVRDYIRAVSTASIIRCATRE